MPRYIDADALKDELELADFETDSRMLGGQTVLFEYSVFKIVDSAPTISPDEVRGVGKWETKHDKVAWWYECSCCHEKPLISNFGAMENLSAYCPNCGAKMEVSEDA